MNITNDHPNTSNPEVKVKFCLTCRKETSEVYCTGCEYWVDEIPADAADLEGEDA